MIRNLLNRFRAGAAIALGLVALTLHGPAFAQSYSVVGPFHPCEASGNCERGDFAFNLEGGVSVSLSAHDLVVNEDNGRWEGVGSFEIRESAAPFALLAFDPNASFSILTGSQPAVLGCAEVTVLSLLATGSAVDAGSNFVADLTGVPQAAGLIGCPDTKLEGSVVIAKGSGFVKKSSWGKLKGGVR